MSLVKAKSLELFRSHGYYSTHDEKATGILTRDEVQCYLHSLLSGK